MAAQKGSVKARKGSFVKKTSSFQDLSAAQRLELADRVRACADAIGTHAKAAKAARVSVRQLRKYLAGEVVPPLIAAGNLAFGSGHSLEWVLTGRGSRQRSPDGWESRMSAAVAAADSTQVTLALGRQVEAALVGIYGDLFGQLSEEDQDIIVGRSVDSIRESDLGAESWPSLIKLIAAAHKISLAVLKPEK
jgi:hypothetical protein